MNKEMDIKDMVPVKTSERHVILDALRGFAYSSGYCSFK